MCNVIRVIYSLYMKFILNLIFILLFYNSLLPSLLHEYEAFVGALQQQVDFYKVRLREQHIAFCAV